MKNKVLISSILLLICILPCYGKHDVEIDGVYYNLSFDDFTAEVVGREIRNVNVTIPNEISINNRVFVVKSIGQSAFDERNFVSDIQKKNRLKNIQIGDSICEIKYCAFSNCKSLSNIKLGTNIKRVGGYIFSDSNIGNLEIVDDIKAPMYHGALERLQYNGVYVHNNLGGIESIQTCFVDVPIIDIRVDKIGTMIISGIKCVPDNVEIQYDTKTSYIRNSYLKNGGIENLIINADNKELPNMCDADIKNLIVLYAYPPMFDHYHFRKNAYLETTLYVLDDAYSEYMNHPEWKRFLNIKKYSEIENSLSPEIKSKMRFNAPTIYPIDISKYKKKVYN